MKTIGKFILFLISYLLLFILLVFLQFVNLIINQKVCALFEPEQYPTLIAIILYSILCGLSFYFLHSFKDVYKQSTLASKRSINITEISSGSSDVMAYLISFIIPIIYDPGAIMSASLDTWISLIKTWSLIIFVGIIGI